jgi:hypothetical protein
MPLLNYQTPPKVKKEEEKLSYRKMFEGIQSESVRPATSPAGIARQVLIENQGRIGQEPQEPVGTGTVIWEGIKSLPREIVAKGLTGIQGIAGAEVAEPDWSDKFIAETERLREERFRKYDMGREVFPGFNVGDLAQLPSNLAYSISTLIPAVGAGVTAGLFTGGIGGWAAGAGVGGSAAYRMASGEIMRSYLKEMDLKKMQETGRGLTKAEETKLKADFDDKAQAYGAWEAIPEAIGGVGAGKIIANTVLGSAIKKAVGKELATKLLARAFGGWLLNLGSVESWPALRLLKASPWIPRNLLITGRHSRTLPLRLSLLLPSWGRWGPAQPRRMKDSFRIRNHGTGSRHRLLRISTRTSMTQQ